MKEVIIMTKDKLKHIIINNIKKINDMDTLIATYTFIEHYSKAKLHIILNKKEE